MNLEQCLKAAEALDTIFLATNTIRAEQTKRGISYEHLRWMVQQMRADMSEDKALRWLGYIQGVLVAMGDATLEEMKAISRSASGE